MKQRIANALEITVEGIDLTTAQAGSLEVYVRQSDFFRIYSPTVISAGTMLITMPKADAMLLTPGRCMLQLALTDVNGTPQASDVREVSVAALLKEAGYGD